MKLNTPHFRNAALFIGLTFLVNPGISTAQTTQDTGTSQTQNVGHDSDHGFNYGWLGLLGLLGLAGVRRGQTASTARLATDTR